jgi:hypothetical protein
MEGTRDHSKVDDAPRTELSPAGVRSEVPEILMTV